MRMQGRSGGNVGCPSRILAVLVHALVGTGFALDGVALASEEPQSQPSSAWKNSTELSLVLTDGNSSAQTVGFKETLERKTKLGRSRLRLDALVSYESDDSYLLVEPGITFLPGEILTNYATSAVRPGAEPDLERYFAEGRYEGNFPWNATWNAGASWDRNDDAGILNRYIVFAGFGRIFRDTPDFAFRVNYGLSGTDREEEVPDPEKEQQFVGARLSSDFMDKWGEATTYDNDFTFNISLEDLSDYNAEMVQGLAVKMGKHLSLKVSLQWLYASEPALEDVDVIVRLETIDPDGIPGNGDEYFQTVSSGGFESTLGEDRLRKEHLDTTFRTSLMISF
jgi:putative salt-induced outer membrane protein YdiY